MIHDDDLKLNDDRAVWRGALVMFALCAFVSTVTEALADWEWLRQLVQGIQ